MTQSKSSGDSILKDRYMNGRTTRPARRRKGVMNTENYSPSGWAGPGQLAYRPNTPMRKALKKRIK